MKGIKIYRVKCEYNTPWLEEHIDGHIVKLTDHKAVVETMQKRIEELESGVQSNIDRAKRYKDHKKKPNQCVDLIHYELTKLINNKV